MRVSREKTGSTCAVCWMPARFIPCHRYVCVIVCVCVCMGAFVCVCVCVCVSACVSFHPLPQRPPSTPGEKCVRKHGTIPKLPAKYPSDSSWPTDIPKWLARAPPSHSSAFFAKFAAEVTPRREWRAHPSAVQSLSVCYTVAAQQPSLLSSGDDGHVRLWDMNGACVGSLAQVRCLTCGF